jgi:hybrid cluster-associated redox disulfide protein
VVGVATVSTIESALIIKYILLAMAEPHQSVLTPISVETPIGPLISTYPIAREIITAYGLHCDGCLAAGFDTLGEGARLHRLPTEELSHLISDLNESIAVWKRC